MTKTFADGEGTASERQQRHALVEQLETRYRERGLLDRDFRAKHAFPGGISDLGDNQLRCDQQFSAQQGRAGEVGSGFVKEPLAGDARVDDQGHRLSRSSRIRSVLSVVSGRGVIARMRSISASFSAVV